MSDVLSISAGDCPPCGTAVAPGEAIVMNATGYLRSGVRLLAGAVGLAAASYAAYVGITWLRYGRATHAASDDDGDSLLDLFIPAFDVAERHHVRVVAPADVTLSAAVDMDLGQSRIVRGIFKARGLVLGADPDETMRPRAWVAQAKALGWGVLAQIPGREIVFGAVTRPWMAKVVFRALRPEEFAAFHEPDYVKIVWTLRADPVGAAESIFRTETRVATTDQAARAKFRRYWSFFSPGIVMIRRLSLGLVKTEAERRARDASPEQRRAELRGTP